MISFSSPKDQQSISNIHAHFYDPIGIWLENWLKESSLVNNFLCFFLLGINVHNRFNFSFRLVIFFFLLLLFILDVYICADMKELEWLHWKYDYT